jgi:hypothetical protein
MITRMKKHGLLHFLFGERMGAEYDGGRKYSCKRVYKSRPVSFHFHPINYLTLPHRSPLSIPPISYQITSQNQAFSSKMKSIIAVLTLACVASAATLAPLAVCNGKAGQSCPQAGQRACENNGGHSVR